MRMGHIHQFRQCSFFICLGMFLSLSLSVKADDLEGYNDRIGITLSFLHESRTVFSRKLLFSPDKESKRIGEDCSNHDISVYQTTTHPLPDGVPAFTVEIVNACVSGCKITDIHVKCGWFSSVRLINPRVFRRLWYNDCLVNDGQPLAPGQMLSFQYANSFSYPLSVSSASCF